MIFEANWTLDGDQLHFTDVRPPRRRTYRHVRRGSGVAPWTRVGDAPSDTTTVEDTSPADDDGDAVGETTSASVVETAAPTSVSESAEFPEGVYQRESTSDELIAHGAGSDFGLWFAGVVTMTFDQGTQRLDDAVGAGVALRYVHG